MGQETHNIRPRLCASHQGCAWYLGVVVMFLLVAHPQILAEEVRQIRLRSVVIDTPERAMASPSVTAQSEEAPVSGLYLLQVEGDLPAEVAAVLKGLNTELIRSVPQDAFIAKLRGTRLNALRQLPFVRWVGSYQGDYKLHPKVAALKGGTARVSLVISPRLSREDLLEMRGWQRFFTSVGRTRFGHVWQGTVSTDQLAVIKNSNAVLWIEPAANPRLYDEIASEIVDGAAEGAGARMAQLGFDGRGVVVAVADSGLDNGTKENMHPDLAGRVDYFLAYGTLTSAADEHSHGTHVSGIVAGNGATGETDEEGYLYGIGVAPGAHLIAQRIFDGLGGYEPPDDLAQLARDAVQHGAIVGSNSWGDDTAGAYDANAMLFDAQVRDADSQTPGDQPYILEFSAGNAGESGSQTIGSPAVGKNVIATGASGNRRDGEFYASLPDQIADFSSRGPCEDGRIKPDVVAPGTWIASLQSASASDENAWLPISPNYQFQGGTSQAGPHVAGAAAVFVQYYRETHAGLPTPSPALVKASLINSAVDMDDSEGTDAVPNNDEGWGRVDLTQIIGADRKYEFIEQSAPLATGQVFEHKVIVSDNRNSLKITLVYTDVPGFPGAAKALVNDLDLEVISPSGTVYRGNQFEDGESTPNATSFDAINNVEAVHLAEPLLGEYTVRVIARSVTEDALQATNLFGQDFAMVISGDLPLPGQGVVSLDRMAYSSPSVAQVKLIDFDLAGQAKASVTLSSSAQANTVLLALSALGNRGVFTGSVSLVTGPAAIGQIKVAHGGLVKVSYADASPQRIFETTAQIDLVAPIISGINATNRFGREVITWLTDEPASIKLFFGTQALEQGITNNVLNESHEVRLPPLPPGKTNYFAIEAVDAAGNTTRDDNGGRLYAFVTAPPAKVLLVNHYVHTADDESMEIPVTGYTAALDHSGITYEVWDATQDNLPVLADLAPFRAVIWRFNESFYVNGVNTIGASTASVLTNYLQSGGALFISSMELLSRALPPGFRSDVLQVAGFKADPNGGLGGGCDDCDEDRGVSVAVGDDLEPTTSNMALELVYDRPGEEFAILDLAGIFTIGPNLSDTFTPSTNSTTIFADGDSERTVGIRYPRTGQDGRGRVVFLSFPFESVSPDAPSPDNRDTLMANILHFLIPGVNGGATLAFDRTTYDIPSVATLEVADSDLIGKSNPVVWCYSHTDTNGVSVRIFPTTQPGVYRGRVALSAGSSGEGTLAVRHDDILRVEYFDEQNNERIQLVALIDDVPPIISDVGAAANYQNADVQWSTSELADSFVQYGESKLLGRSQFASDYLTQHHISLVDLKTDQLYYYKIIGRDQAGNVVEDDNHGEFYVFKTLAPEHVPFRHTFEQGVEGWSLEDLMHGDTPIIWELGAPANSLQTNAYSGTNAWGTNLRDSIITDASTDLVSPPFELAGGNSFTLRFQTSYDFSGDGNEQAQLWLLTNNAPAQIVLEDYSGGLAVNWEEEEINLSPYAGQVVQLVWHYFLTDLNGEGASYPGWLVDDISVEVTNVFRGRISVTNNIAAGSFVVSGQVETNGSGLKWVSGRLPIGEYSVTWNPVPYYDSPVSQTNSLTTNDLSFSAAYSFPDLNHNGISDYWEDEHFGSVAADHPAGKDSDGDGMSDYAEFVAGTDPMNPSSRFTLSASLQDVQSGRWSLVWHSVPRHEYRVQVSEDLQNWTTFPWLTATETNTTFLLPLSTIPTVSQAFKVEVRQ